MTWSFIILALLRLVARRSGRVGAMALAFAKKPLLDAVGEGVAPVFAAPDEFKKAVRDMLDALAGTINRPLVKMLVKTLVIPFVTDSLLDLLWDLVIRQKEEPAMEAGPPDEVMAEALDELMCP